MHVVYASTRVAAGAAGHGAWARQGTTRCTGTNTKHVGMLATFTKTSDASRLSPHSSHRWLTMGDGPTHIKVNNVRRGTARRSAIAPVAKRKWVVNGSATSGKDNEPVINVEPLRPTTASIPQASKADCCWAQSPGEVAISLGVELGLGLPTQEVRGTQHLTCLWRILCIHIAID